jgi:hypothetical protein
MLCIKYVYAHLTKNIFHDLDNIDNRIVRGKGETMNINGIGGAGASQNTAGTSAGKSGQMDSESKNLQQQIEKLQNDLKEISSNQEMPADTKMKKRQEIQKQISELQIQLRQHQIDVKREEREKKKEESSFDDLMGTKKQKNQSDNANVGMSANSMTAMLSADVSIKQANVQGSTAQKMNGRANVLEAEIALDSSSGGNVELKEAELSDARKAAQKATSDQLSSLAQAGEELEKASEKENTENRTEDKDKSDKSKPGTEKDGEKQTDNISGTPDTETPEEQASYNYHPVDVRL